MADQKLKVDIIGDASKLNKALNTASGKLQSFGSKVSGVGKRLSIGLSLPLGIAGGAAIKMASDFEESMNKVDVAFGQSSGEVKDFAKTTLSQFGIAQGTALDMAALFGDMSTSMGLTTGEAANMSKALVGLAGDLASFKNMNIQEVTTALNGVFTGETESLKRLGIVMTQVNLQQFAQEKGIQKTLKAMTQAEKVNLRYQFVMSKTTNAQGDFARTSDGAANQMRIFQESMKELGANIGAIILPAFIKVVKFGNQLVSTLQNLDPTTKKVVVIFAALAAAAGPLLYLAGTVIPALAAAFAALTLSSGLIVVAIGAVVAALGATVKHQALLSTIKDLNLELEKNELAYKKAKKASDGSTESSLRQYKANQKLLKTKLDLLKAQQDAEQGAIANLLGIESDEYLRLGKEIEKTKNSIKNYDLAINGLESQTKKTIEETKDLTKSLEELKKIKLDKFKLEIETKKTSAEFVKEFDESIGAELSSMDSFSDAFNSNIAEAFDPDSVLVLGESFEELDQQLEGFLENYNTKAKKAAELTQFWGMQIGGILMDSFTALANGGDFFSTLMDGLKKLIIRLAAAAAAALVLFVLTGGASAGSGGVSKMGSFKTIFSSLAGVPEFANGGIVSGPTLGLMGEYSGIRSNPEVIAPLDKLKGMMGGTGSQNINVGGEFRIQGQDLVVALQRAEKNRSRLL
jgi:hypothetical protein